MYSDRKKRKTAWIAAAVLLLALGAALFLFLRQSRRDLAEESAQAIRETIRRGALQCYVVEGVYPPDLSYLEENYGLQINRQDFYVTYDVFASNLPPNVIVRAKK